MSYEDCNALGGMTAYNRAQDPKRLAFQAARYKHVAKILEGRDSVIELGCADGFFSPIVRQHVGRLVAIDVDKLAIRQAKRHNSQLFPVDFKVGDLFECGLGDFDAVYALDVIEHIPREIDFVASIRLRAPFAVVGTPSIESQAYASEISRREHVRCLSKAELRAEMAEHYKHVVVLGMNDETLHTGFDAMCHYLLAIGCD